MRRALILISNPGIQGEQNYAPTTEKAIDQWESFFRSPIGGFWQDNEVFRFDETHLIGTERLRTMIGQLNQPELCDYSVVVFCGHGLRTIDNCDVVQLPLATVNDLNLLPLKEILALDDFGQPLTNVKRTVIADACRSMQPLTYNQLFEDRQYSGILQINGDDCSVYYNKLIEDCHPHVELLQSTRAGQFAFGDIEGSAYCKAVFDTVRRDELIWGSKALTDRTGHFSVSMKEMHDAAEKEMSIEGIQMPQYSYYGEAESGNFPFSAYQVPVVHTLESILSEIEILED